MTFPFQRRINPRPTPPRATDNRAVTLVEMLVAVTILAVLAALAYPQVSRIVEQSRSAKCISRLRTIGMLFHAFAADNNGKIKLFRDGSAGGEKRWYNQLETYANLTPDAAREAFGCPSFKAADVNDWFCYGFRVGGSPGAIVRDSAEAPRLYNLNIRAVQNPSRFFIMGDSITVTTGRQTFRIVPPGIYSESGIHLRHQDRANILFLDGHLEALDAPGLARLEITGAVDAQKRTISIPAPPQ